ncbi:MAG TPA: PPC domain-containing protein [Bryobacteraceae bacterium]|nr:PPC domain-containing protein [Bryobacteraceae bacterium]
MYKLTALGFAISLALFAAAPELTRLEPRGAQRGKSFTLTLEGENLPEGAQVLTTLPATFTPLAPPQEKMSAGRKLPFLVELKADAAVGTYPLRVQTPDGVSNILLFTVGAFPEVTEEESKPDAREHSNDSIEKAEPIEPPATVNGTLDGPDRDYYRVHAKQGARLVFEVEARRAGSAIDPVIEIVDASGKQIARNEDAAGLGVDSRVDLTFPRDGDYYAVVHDARFSQQRQNFYRLKVADYSYADGIFPLGWKRGEKVDVEFFGGSLKAPVKSPVDLSAIDPKLEFTRVSLPRDSGSLPFLFATSDLPEKLEPARRSANDAAPLDPATVMNGRISKPGEVDRYKLNVAPGEHWEIELHARGLGTSRLDGVITIYDAKGKKLASAGDKPPKEDVFSLLSAGRTSSDPWLEFQAPKDAHDLTVAVEDLLGRGGPGFAYRLIARRQPPDFKLTVLEPYVNIPANGTVSVNVSIERHGFPWPIQLSVPNLGEDYIVEGGHLPGEWKDDVYSLSRRGMLTITAKPGAKPKKLAELAIWGEGKTADGSLVRRKAQCLGMITSVAGGTGISDAEGRENQSPFLAPWLGLDLPVAMAKEESGLILPEAPRVLRLVQGTGYALKWNFKPRNPDARPPENVGVDVASPAAAEISVRRAKTEKKEEKYADHGEFSVQTTTHTSPEKYDLVMFAESKEEDTAAEPMITAAITLEVVQGYSVTAPKEPVPLQAGGKTEIVGSFHREPEFAHPVSLTAEYLPAHVSCQPVDLTSASSEYRIACQAEASAKPGEYEFQLTPASVVVGLDKREMPYKIAPVAAKLIISDNKATQAAR